MSDPFAQTLHAPFMSAPEGTPLPSVEKPRGEAPTETGPADELASSPEPTSLAAMLWPDSAGRRVAGRYEILGLLGAGGMGNVYRARDLELGELVALKMLRPEIGSNPAALDRFRLEVKLARRVTHPHVARMFDIGEDGGERYLTMELVDGEPLSSLLRREGRLTCAHAATIARGICEALSAAHAAGVIHRDLKPDNVLLAKDGRTVVTDFGIAQAVGAEQVRVTSGIVGTPAYMSPEQVEGKAAGAAADLYALGVMLFEMVTGELPWSGDSVFAVAAARLLNPPPDPMTRRSDLFAPLAQVIQHLMARQPTDRPPSADAARTALLAVPATPPTYSQQKNLARSALHKCKKQIAVLPLRNAGPKEDAYIADGLTEDLIDLLSMADGIRVRSRGMVSKYCCGDRDPREVGRELDVQVVVDGTVRRTPAGVRVTVRLVSVADGVQIWHRRFDRKHEDILSVSDDAARAIAEALAVELAAPERAATHPEAIELYLRARSLFLRFFEDSAGESLQLFARARELAPDDPRILAGYAMAVARKWARDPALGVIAREAAENAVARAPNLADSHVAFALVRLQERREPDTVRSLKRALDLSRTNAEAHDMLGRMLVETRLLDEGQSHLEAALMAEPDAHLPRVMLARTHMLRGDWDKALGIVFAGEKIEPSLLPAIGRYCLWRGDIDRARSIHDQVKTLGMDLRLTKLILNIVVERKLPSLDVPNPSDIGHRLHGFICQLSAEAAAYLGDIESALDFFERAGDSGCFDVAWADGCPLFGALRDNPRFRATRSRIEARAATIEMAYLETPPRAAAS